MGIVETVAIAGAVATPVAAFVADRMRCRKSNRRKSGERRETSGEAPEATGERRDACDRRATDELRADCRASIAAYDSALANLAAALQAPKRRPSLVARIRRALAA